MFLKCINTKHVIVMEIIIRNIFCLLGLFLLAPIILLASILIFLDDGPPILFSQTRVGLNRKKFIIYKLRTMENHSPSLGTHEVNSSLYLPSSNILRKLKIDELPQILNVIKGDINLIGFRPGLVNQDQLNEARDRNGIFNYMPGITGLAQVTGYDMSNPEMLSKIEKYYYINKSTKLDLQILVCTLTGIFRIKLKKLVTNLIDV